MYRKKLTSDSLSTHGFLGAKIPIPPSIQGCTVLQNLYLQDNLLTGGLEPLRGCTALQWLFLHTNQLMGGLEPLRGCTALQNLFLSTTTS